MVESHLPAIADTTSTVAVPIFQGEPAPQLSISRACTSVAKITETAAKVTKPSRSSGQRDKGKGGKGHGASAAASGGGAGADEEAGSTESETAQKQQQPPPQQRLQKQPQLPRGQAGPRSGGGRGVRRDWASWQSVPWGSRGSSVGQGVGGPRGVGS
ncbi:hypothetical protein CLOM_g2705 [Closterium sp. NIES-68]|nr:hypothetical protein CLOM_g2705 [Closterium sp. NIES-68]GJP85298.1 hypothetical protein CLOP_g15409 [Closterium sp. NIES-67]